MGVPASTDAIHSPFALERCYFVAIGGNHGGFFVSPEYIAGRTLIVLNSCWKIDAFQSAVAHEIAHLWRGHPGADLGPDVERHEDEAAELVQEWGFSGIGGAPYGERP